MDEQFRVFNGVVFGNSDYLAVAAFEYFYFLHFQILLIKYVFVYIHWASSFCFDLGNGFFPGVLFIVYGRFGGGDLKHLYKCGSNSDRRTSSGSKFKVPPHPVSLKGFIFKI